MLEEDLTTPPNPAAGVEYPPAVRDACSESVPGVVLRLDQLVAHRFRQEPLFGSAIPRPSGCGIGECGHFLSSRLYLAAL